MSSLPFARLAWSAVSSMLGSDSYGYFVAGGVSVRHVGCLIDQPKVAALVLEAREFLMRDRPIDAVDAALGRVDVTLRDGPIRGEHVEFDARALWTGGRIDRGVVEINVSADGWEAMLRAHLIALIETEVVAE